MTSINPTATARSNVPNSLETLVENVQEDSGLTPYEKETSLLWAKPDEKADIYTAEGSLIRRLLRHPLFEVEKLRVHPDAGCGHRVPVTDYPGGPITGIWGSFPLQAIKIQSASRAQSAHCHIVSAEGLVYR